MQINFIFKGNNIRPSMYKFNLSENKLKEKQFACFVKFGTTPMLKQKIT